MGAHTRTRVATRLPSHAFIVTTIRVILQGITVSYGKSSPVALVPQPAKICLNASRQQRANIVNRCGMFPNFPKDLSQPSFIPHMLISISKATEEHRARVIAKLASFAFLPFVVQSATNFVFGEVTRCSETGNKVRKGYQQQLQQKFDEFLPGSQRSGSQKLGRKDKTSNLFSC